MMGDPVTVTMPLDVVCRTLTTLQTSYERLLATRVRWVREGRDPDVFDLGLQEIGAAIVAVDVGRQKWMRS